MVLSKITGVGKYVPEKILTNFDLEKMVDTNDKWITERTGIKERRIANESETSSYMATEALKNACEKAEIKPEDLDFIICTTNSPDNIFPATAMKILSNLGIKDRPGFDLQAGCTSFTYGLELADSLLKNGNKYKHIAVIGVERLSKLIDWEDRNTCVLFGDGAGSVIVTRNEADNKGIIDSVLGGDSTKTKAIRIEAGMSEIPTTKETVENRMHFVKMDGQDVFKFAVRVIPNSIKKLLKRTDMKLEQINLIIPHQANTRIVESAAKFLKTPIEKFYMNIHKYGNTSSASIPIALEEAIEEGKIKSGDNIITVGFGAGLTYAANLIKF
jgi:3-oxoacyl-[acyl-carrier-protein] synthase III